MLKTFRFLNAAAIALLMPVFATVAMAHAKLVKEAPAHDATVPPPTEISLKFSTAVEAAFSSIEVRDAAGALVKVGTLATAGDDKTAIAVPLPTPLAAGKYTVEWRALTAGDGHKIKGSYSFTAAP
jgi:copper resistance protein C